MEREEMTLESVVAADEKSAPKKFKKQSRKKVCSFCVDHAKNIDYKEKIIALKEAIKALKSDISPAEKNKFLKAFFLDCFQNFA
jgi:ribosomal protein S18